MRGEDLQARCCLAIHVLAAPHSTRQQQRRPSLASEPTPPAQGSSNLLPSIMVLADSKGPDAEASASKAEEEEVRRQAQHALAAAGVIPLLVSE